MSFFKSSLTQVSKAFDSLLRVKKNPKQKIFHTVFVKNSSQSKSIHSFREIKINLWITLVTISD